MAIKFPEDFRWKTKEGGEFSSRQAGFIFAESFDLLKGNEPVPLEIWDHIEFVCAALWQYPENQCFWFVENPSEQTLEILEETFGSGLILNGSIAGYFELDKTALTKYWNLCRRVEKQEPWHNEQAWGLAGISETISPPKSRSWLRKPCWSVEHIFQYSNRINNIFVQMGSFGFFGLRETEASRNLIASEFPEWKAKAHKGVTS